MKIYFASDHAGFELKNGLVEFIRTQGFEVVDLGPATYDKEDDYPDTVSKAAELVSKNPEEDKAIVIGGSGQGEAMVCNRYSHVRAAVYYGGPIEIVSLSRAHNDANILSIGARFVDKNEIGEIVREWLLGRFSNDTRHIRRIKKIDLLDLKA
ncbi:MAG: RpiB/LacA/LacB family sugar-phosphate isomerase [bacterium]